MQDVSDKAKRSKLFTRTPLMHTAATIGLLGTAAAHADVINASVEQAAKDLGASLDQRNECYRFVTEYSTNLHKTVSDRFPDFDLLNSFCVLGASQMADGADLGECACLYGIDDITKLADHYRGRIDYGKVFGKWLIVKPLMYARRNTHTMNQFIAWLNSNSAISVPNMLILFKLAAIIPIGNAVSERGFSSMNNLKGSKSNRMDSGSGECDWTSNARVIVRSISMKPPRGRWCMIVYDCL